VATHVLAASVLLLAESSTAGAQQSSRPIQIRVFPSLTPGVSRSRVHAALLPAMDFISEKIRYPIEVELEAGGGDPEDLRALGRKLNDGTYDLGAAWGLEYGWLLQDYPDLRPFVVAVNGEKAPFRSELLVRRKDTVPGLARLKGKRLARFRHAPLMDQLFLDEMLRKAGLNPRGFFVLGEELPSAKDAFLAVKNGKADCVMINVTDFSRFEKQQPAVARALVALEVTPPYPAPLMIGRIQNLERRRRGLWNDAQQIAVKMQETDEGQQGLRFWHFDYFLKPDAQYIEDCKTAARHFPISALRPK
jgi:ABC-type phosphate/phosphonate transport system substrate-binding protein